MFQAILSNFDFFIPSRKWNDTRFGLTYVQTEILNFFFVFQILKCILGDSKQLIYYYVYLSLSLANYPFHQLDICLQRAI